MPGAGTFKLFIGNLDEKTTTTELKPLFEKYGSVVECDVVKNYGLFFIQPHKSNQIQKKNQKHWDSHTTRSTADDVCVWWVLNQLTKINNTDINPFIPASIRAFLEWARGSRCHSEFERLRAPQFTNESGGREKPSHTEYPNNENLRRQSNR